jgi:hypothetical protein
MAELPSGGRRRPSGELQLSTVAMVSLVVSSECELLFGMANGDLLQE